MAYTVKCNGGYRIYDSEFESIEQACEHAKAMFRLYADTGGHGSGALASQLTRIEDEIDAIRKSGSGGTVAAFPDGHSQTWTIKKKGWFG